MMRASFELRELDHLRDFSRRGMRSVTMTISRMPFSSASNTASFVKRGGTETTAPSTCCFDGDVADAVVDGYAVDVAARAARRDAADDLCAVSEVLAGEAHRLAARDALDDERGVLGDQDRHVLFAPA